MADIAVSNVSKSFDLDDGTSLPVLDSISFQVRDGEFFSILGPSGCGKSTILNILARMSSPDDGDLVIDGEADGGHPRLGFVFQDPTLLDWKSVGDNLRFVLESKGVPKAEQDRLIEENLELVGLDGFRDEYPQSLSGGMRQRVGLARALCVDPDLLLMDEPFGSLDEITARKLRRDLQDIWREEQKTIVFVTHNISEAIYLSDRIAILSEKPTSIIDTITVDIERPRDFDDSRLMEYEEVIHDVLGIE